MVSNRAFSDFSGIGTPEIFLHMLYIKFPRNLGMDFRLVFPKKMVFGVKNVENGWKMYENSRKWSKLVQEGTEITKYG